jgi:hypothetical protein
MEDNKLLAEFMGFQQTNIGWYDAEEVLLRAERDNTFDNLKFHSDWNWLMEVVEKIESLGVVVEIRESVCYISPFPNNYVSELEETKIQATYIACVRFVKWYNEQNKI